MRMAARPGTASRPIVALETPPMTWSVKSCQLLPIAAMGGSRLRSSMIADAADIPPPPQRVHRLVWTIVRLERVGLSGATDLSDYGLPTPRCKALSQSTPWSYSVNIGDAFPRDVIANIAPPPAPNSHSALAPP